MKRQDREIIETVLPQMRTIHARLWDEYWAAGHPKGLREKDLQDWLLETGKARVEKGER